MTIYIRYVFKINLFSIDFLQFLKKLLEIWSYNEQAPKLKLTLCDILACEVAPLKYYNCMY